MCGSRGPLNDIIADFSIVKRYLKKITLQESINGITVHFSIVVRYLQKKKNKTLQEIKSTSY